MNLTGAAWHAVHQRRSQVAGRGPAAQGAGRSGPGATNKRGSTLRPYATWTLDLNRSARCAGQPGGAALAVPSDPRRTLVSRQWITSSLYGGR